MPSCKILATGHCALKSKQSQDNRLADPESQITSSVLNYQIIFIPPFPAGACWKETIWPWAWPYYRDKEEGDNMTVSESGTPDFKCLICLFCASERETERYIPKQM